MSKDILTKKQQKELKSLIEDVTFEAKEVRLDYEKNPSEVSGSVPVVGEFPPCGGSGDCAHPTHESAPHRAQIITLMPPVYRATALITHQACSTGQEPPAPPPRQDRSP